jgi:ABC-2 type transport system ATP-binding protein
MTDTIDQPTNRNGNPLLEAIDLSMRYPDGVQALNGISFSVRPGEIYAMLGANGAGKTTTIHLFLGFLEPSAGETRIAGIVSHREPLEAKQHIAFVSENVHLYPTFTAIQNLDFFTRLAGRNDLGEDDLERALGRVGLQQEAWRRKLRTFSKGMRQKTALAIAMLKEAPALLLDEPTSGLDPEAGLDLIRLLEELRDEGRAILMSTHDVFRAKQVADVVGILKAGELVLEKQRDEIADQDLESLYVRAMQ